MTSNKLSKLVATLSILCCIFLAGGCDSANQSSSTNQSDSTNQSTSADSGVIGQETLNSNDADGRRFVRFNFDSRATALHTISVSWDSIADIRFNVFDSSGIRINSSVVQGSNPGVWTGELVAGNQYSMSVWSAVDEANITSNIEASIELSNIEPVSATRYSDDADRSAWVLDGPAPTLDYAVGENTDGWGRALLRVRDVLLVGGDFQGIKPGRSDTNITQRPWFAALDALTGQPVTTFNTPDQINSVVRSLVLSPDGTRVYVGGDFGLMALDAMTGQVEFAVPVIDEGNPGRVFEIVVTDTQLYIGGDFSQISNTPRNNLARLSLQGEVDTAWNPNVAGGISRGRSAPVQSMALSSSNNTLYVGGTYLSINGTPVSTTERDTTVSMLAISTVDGSVNAERFVPELVLGEFEDTKDLVVIDIAVFDAYVIIAWGGPNYLTLHQSDGARLQQYSGPGDLQVIHIQGDLVIVGHHGEFLGTLTNPIPPEAVVSIDPLDVEPFKLHSFRLDPASARLTPEQTWSINGTFGVWAIEASEDSIWIAGDLRRAGANSWDVEGLARFPAF